MPKKHTGPSAIVAFVRTSKETGSANPASKLTEAQVLEIRAAVKKGERQRVIAARHGVSQSLVSAIASGKVRANA